jgi:hypothetical protein
MKPLTDKQREILAKLVAIAEQIEGYRATLAMLEHERFRLQSELRATGYQPGQPEQQALLP